MIRAFVHVPYLEFDDGEIAEEYGVYVNLPGVLPVGSELYLPMPKHWEHNDPLELTIRSYGLQANGILWVYCDQKKLCDPIGFIGDRDEILGDLIAIGWTHFRYVERRSAEGK